MSEHPATDLIVAWWAERFQVEEKREAFRVALRARLCEAWAGHQEVTLDVDHDPKGALLLAVQDAGIECRGFLFSARGILPSKTFTMIDAHEVTSREGYGAPFVELWRAS